MVNSNQASDKKSRADLFFVYMAYTLRYVYLLLLIPFYGRVLGVEGYGVVLAAMSLMTITWRFVEWGFTTSGIREIAPLGPERYAGLVGRHVSARTLLALLGAIGGAGAIMVSPVLHAHPLTAAAGVALGIVSAFNLGWYFSGTHRPRSAVKLEVLGFAVSLVLVFSLVRGPDDSALVLLALLGSGLVASGAGYWMIRNEIHGARFSIKDGSALVRSSSTMFLYTGTSTLLVASSTYLLSILSTTAEVGSFGAAERLVGVGLALMGPAGQVFVPKIAKLFIEDEAHAFVVIRKGMLLIVGMGVAGLVCSLALGPWVVPLIFGPGFEKSVGILQCMAFLFPISAFNLVVSFYVLIPQHKESVLAKVVLVGAAVSLVCAVPLGMQYGGMGMAIARIGGELIVCASLTYYCWKMGILARIFNVKK
ncbi:oligosaccharide flippase family protein [Pseudomonas turukhanskensis]|uniref:Oligosaccharide translocase/flippase n=1 Tax=Pseudomonas turukhanskensis TaxID=1806536 RepID=A0A9W6K514_9PSED|nr:oligosaccharide flippase family protein [Pseudomonas turukhanskensis]GLK88109.1 oligosaccharide translocase/flippase [Pseudomonas turukhanskensis]